MFGTIIPDSLFTRCKAKLRYEDQQKVTFTELVVIEFITNISRIKTGLISIVARNASVSSTSTCVKPKCQMQNTIMSQTFILQFTFIRRERKLE